MSIRSHIPVDIELLGKYLSGDASPEEAMAIDEWLADTPENRRLFQELTDIWESIVPGTGYQLPDKEQALLEWQRLIKNKDTAKVYPIKNAFPFKYVAAAVLGLICVTSAYFFFHKKTADKMISEVVKQTNTEILRDTLPDHSIVVLNSHSQLRYTQQFNDSNRALTLHGQAWFDVATNPQKPFVIQAGDIHIKVLGTSFNVIQDSNKIEATVKTGAILMYKGNNNITVKAGQKGVFQVSSQQFSVMDTIDMNVMGYATRVFNFENATLKDMTTELGKAYNVNFVFENKELENRTMSSPFENNPLQYILEVISITLNVECRQENNTIYISGKGQN
ncbi:MAG: FecR domain-containing protein [Chitinophaga sp.]|uniref:FecR family protein n=1 Tax=Chitinophaga sp. TaxID=1869181 RepID=UPI0025C1CBD5|nr:FecR family protein [Chitinophaga sp.]MBV8253384.1 FecR domain-containing protein [Chitinophaga sp.]